MAKCLATSSVALSSTHGSIFLGYYPEELPSSAPPFLAFSCIGSYRWQMSFTHL